MTSDQNKNKCMVDSNGNIVKTIFTKKKSRYDAKHRIKDSSKIQKYIKSLEDKIDILEDDLIELKWEIDDIKKNLSQTKTKSKTKHNTSSESSGSD
jgi:predicted RNase H-like nuclease (RuvC/YqgF family)